MNESTELTVAEQPQQLITIEPAKYVELVFEPFAKQYADAVDAVRGVAYDIKTTAGMATAIKHRATFRDIRVASEKARKLRKAPIIEIGKLLDSRQGEIEATTLPLETMFDEEIKLEEKRKDDEKIAKAVAESARISAIRKKIADLQAMPAEAVGWSSKGLATGIETLEGIEITLEEFAEFAGEAEMVKVAAVAKLGEMLTAQIAHEAEQARIAAEREALERQRAELAEQERKAAAARAEQEAADRAERERIAAEQRAAQEKAAAELRAERERFEAAERAAQEKANAAYLAEMKAAALTQDAMSEIQGIQQQVMIATIGRSGVRRGGSIECIRETLAETEAWEIDPERFGVLAGAAEMAKMTAVAEIRRLLAEAEAREAAEAEAQAEAARAAAEEHSKREAEEAAARAEAVRVEAERQAAVQEQIRRERVQFELNGPGDGEIVSVLAEHYDVDCAAVVRWLAKFNAASFIDEAQEKAA